MGDTRIPSVDKYHPNTCIIAYVGFLMVISNVGALFSPSESDPEIVSDKRYQNGKTQYEAIRAETKMPRYSKCWTNALNMLTLGCKKLDDDTQHQLAFAFTNCFLAKTGREVYTCSAGSDISECVKPMSSEAYNSYTEFFTHTQNICFFLQAQVWQAETQNTVAELTENSALVAHQMETSGQLQKELLKRQNDSLSNQDILLARGNELKGALADSAVDVQHMLKEFQAATAEQRENIMDVFDRIQSLQSLVMGEFTGFYSMVFYTTSLIVSYLLTSTPRTNGARFWLFFLMTMNVVAERLIVSFGASEYVTGAGQVVTGGEIVYARLSMCRKVASVLGILLLLVKSMLYRDLNQINHDLLRAITQQNQQIKHLLQSSAVNPPLEDSLALQTVPNNANKQAYDPLFNKDHIDETPLGYESDSEDCFDSGTTDHTYQADEAILSEAENLPRPHPEQASRDVTPNLLGDQESLHNDSPLEGITNIQPNYSTATFDTGERGVLGAGDVRTSTPQKKLGLPPGRKTPFNISDVSAPTRRYNLRKRTPTLVPTPTVDAESGRNLGRVVQHLADVSVRNSLKTKYTVQRRLYDK